MPGLIRKLVIFASKDGLILQSHGTENQPSLLIDYKTRKVASQTKSGHDTSVLDAHLESHGILGMEMIWP